MRARAGRANDITVELTHFSRHFLLGTPAENRMQELPLILGKTARGPAVPGLALDQSGWDRLVAKQHMVCTGTAVANEIKSGKVGKKISPKLRVHGCGIGEEA